MCSVADWSFFNSLAMEEAMISATTTDRINANTQQSTAAKLIARILPASSSSPIRPKIGRASCRERV